LPGQERDVAGEAASDEVAALQRRLDAALERAAQREEALQSRVVIEQAKGKLAERFQLAPAQAFELLRGAARSARMSIHALAEDVVASRATPNEIVREIRSRSERDPARTR
jgi:AmiR/NasT family two-component response regulator